MPTRRDFMLKYLKDNKFYHIGILLIGFVFFAVSYSLSINYFKGNKNINNNEVLAETKQTSFVKESGTLVAKDTKLEFLIRYSNCLDFINADNKIDESINIDKEKLLGLNEKDLEEIFKKFNYKLEQFTKNDAIFVKDVEGYKYAPDNYFIGIKDEKIVVYKKEKDGKIRVVEKQILNPKSENNSILTIKDIEDKGNLLKTLYFGDKDYQKSNIKDVIDLAQSLCST